MADGDDDDQNQSQDQSQEPKSSWLQTLGVPGDLFQSLCDNGASASSAVQTASDLLPSDPPPQNDPPLNIEPGPQSTEPVHGTDSPDYKRGYQDGLSGGDPNPGPLPDDGLTDYQEGYAKGHDEHEHGSSSADTPPPPAPEPDLDTKYRTALAAENWWPAAEYLNQMSRADIQSRLSELTPDIAASLHQAALDDPNLGANSQVAQLTKDPNAREPNDQDDPNTVFAGENFKIKAMQGVTVGEVGGATAIDFVIWDTDNNRGAVYQYVAVIMTFGTPVSFSGESDWKAFSVSPPRQVDQLSCNASHTAIGAGPIGGMQINLDWVTIYMMTGNTEGGGIEAGGGLFSYVAGSVNVFKGP